MRKILVLTTVLFIVFLSACGSGGTSENDSDIQLSDSDNETEVYDVEAENDVSDADEIVDIDEISDADETDDSADTDDDATESFQTGGIVIFSPQSGDKENMFTSKTILGQGGFFGYSIFSFNDEYWGVSAMHESIPPYDFEKAVGKLYIFKKGSLPDSIEDAHFVLTHPDLTLNAGFSFTTAGTCDINGDGFDDIVVSAHLATYKTAYAAGEFIVFYGSENGWNEENTSISRLSEAYIQQSDCLSQSLVCGDINGDGFDDVMAGGQNAGIQLSGGGSTGMIAFFRGSSDGLEEHEYWVLTPLVEEKAQYFGSSMILYDINDDGIDDLIVAGWGLKESEEAANTGGVYIYYGGTDWQQGPSESYFGSKDSQFGTVIKIIEVEGRKGLGVLAPNEGTHGMIHFFGDMASPLDVGDILPDDGSTISNFETISGVSNYDTLVIAGGNYFMDGGSLICAGIGSDYAFNWELCPWQPDERSGGFGFSVKNVGNIDGSAGDEIVVGMPEYISTDFE